MRKNYNLFNIASLFFILVSLFFLVVMFQSTETTVVSFEDPGLEEAVRNAIDQEEGDIETNDVDLLQELNAADYDIESLEGIEALSELKELNLENNYVESVSPLQELTKLEVLNLRNNEITDLEDIYFDDIVFLPIRDLSLRHNVIRDEEGNDTRLSDITLLGQMITLNTLELRDNHIEDLTPLSNLRDLETLDIRENNFDNIKALEPLTKLEELNLRDNEIESLEPLQYLSRLTYLNIHSVEGPDSLESISNLINLETLIMRNVEIDDEGEFLEKLTNLQRFNAIDSNFESINTEVIENLLARGALQGEVRPVRMLHTLGAPELSMESGFYEDSFELEINNTSDSEVYYTLDGSEPTLNSPTYTQPLPIEQTDGHSLHVVRAKVISENNKISETVTKSYFVYEDYEERFNLPVFSLVTDPDNLFDPEIGIYTKGNQRQSGSDWERPVHLDYFETDGSFALEQELGLRLHGGATRTYPQKSLRMYAKSEYDTEKYMNYDFFDDLNEIDSSSPVTQFKRLLLRNSGNDWSQTMFNDALMQSLVEPLGSVETQNYRPAVVFFNGEYHGIHNIRERFDEYYFETHYGVDSDDLVILENKNSLYRGNNSDVAHYNNMIEYIKRHGLEDTEDFEYIKTLMDVENFRDYFASQIYFGNSDWPHNNIRFWRKTTENFEEDAPYGHDGRWRWLLFDTDHGFYYSEKPYGTKPYPLNHRHNTIDYVMGELDGRFETDEWPNFLFRSLMENTQFKNSFLARMNDLMNSYFSTTMANDQIIRMSVGIENEMPSHIERWGAIESMDQWQMYIDRKHVFAAERPELLRGFIMEEFNIEGTLNINVSNETEMGHVKLNTIDVNSDLPGNTGSDTWSGIYFAELPITLEAIPKEGYRFSHWEGVNSEEENIEIIPSSDLHMQAIFTPLNE